MCLLQSRQHSLSIALSSRKLVIYDRQSAVLASSCLSIQFLLVRMTVSIEARSSLHVVYTDDVPQEPHHIRCWQHGQQFLSLASRSLCVVLANQQLVVATRDNVRNARSQLAMCQYELGVVLVHDNHQCWSNCRNITARHTLQRCTTRHQCILSVSIVASSTHS